MNSESGFWFFFFLGVGINKAEDQNEMRGRWLQGRLGPSRWDPAQRVWDANPLPGHGLICKGTLASGIIVNPLVLFFF